MFFLHETLNRNQQITAMRALLTTTCGAGLFALIALVVVTGSVSLSGAIVGEDRAPSASLFIPSDWGMNPLQAHAYRLYSCKSAAPGTEVMR